MRLIFFILFILALDFYVFQAVRMLVQNLGNTPKIVIGAIYWLIPILLFSYLALIDRTNTTNWKNPGQIIFRTLLFIIYLSKLVVVIPLIIDDLRRGSLFLYHQITQNATQVNYSRSAFLSKFGLVMGAIPLGILSYGIIRNPYRYKVFRETVSIKNLPAGLNGLKIVQISDIHSGSFTFKDPVKNAIDLINQQKADLVFFTGDLVNDIADEMDHFMDVFDKIKAKHGVFSVLGNHDYGEHYPWKDEEHRLANMEKMKEVHQSLGWELLNNENRILEINNEKVVVIGVENYSMMLRFPSYGDLNKAHQNSGPSNYLKLLLSHDPSHWEGQVVPEFKDIDITFSGHTHGMQFGVEIPGWIKWSPIKYIYKQWAGLYQIENQYLYVNRGLGFIGYPGRVGILPEITVLELNVNLG